MTEAFNLGITKNVENNLNSFNEIMNEKEIYNDSACFCDLNYFIYSNKNIINSRFPKNNKKFGKIFFLSFYADDSLAVNFSFGLPLSDKNKYYKEEVIYGKDFNQDNYDIGNNSIFSIYDIHMYNKKNNNNLNYNDLSCLYSNNIKLNFGNENPNVEYYFLINKYNEIFEKEKLNKAFCNFIKYLSKFPIFEYKSTIEIKNKNNNSIMIYMPFHINDKLSIIPIKHIFSKKMNPNKYNVTNSLIIKDNKLVKFNKYKNPILKNDKRKIHMKRSKIKINKTKSFKYQNNKFIIPLEESDSE